MVSLHLSEFLEHHGGKGLKKDVKNATTQVAAEYSYAESLLNELNKIEREDGWDEEIRDIKQAFRILRWLSRSERKADPYEKEVIEDLKELGKHLSSQLKGKEEKLLKHLQVSEEKILFFASFYEGELKKDIKKIRTYEGLIRKTEEEDDGLKQKLLSFVQQTRQGVSELIKWLSSIEEILREIGELEEKALQSSLLKGSGIKRVPTLSELYKAYKYVPPSVEKVSIQILGIKWTKDISTKLVQAADTMMDKTKNEIIAANNVEKTIPVNDTLILKVDMYWSSEDQNVVFRIVLQTSGNQTVADFRCQRKVPFWTIHHRLVNQKYRGQKIGTNMLKLLEDCVRSFASGHGKQNILLEARQIPVVLFSLKNHYLPMTRKDRKNLKILLSGTKDEILITTARGYTSEGGQLPGFMYLKTNLLQEAREHWSETWKNLKKDEVETIDLGPLFSHDPAEYIANGLTIKFVKVSK